LTCSRWTWCFSSSATSPASAAGHRLRSGEHRQRDPRDAWLGVIKVTTVAITVSFGAPRATAVLAVLGYRIVNYWLPLLPGAVAYLRLRLQGSHRRLAKDPDATG
jgi:hypothetical protein